jgi:hypothetical protein
MESFEGKIRLPFVVIPICTIWYMEDGSMIITEYANDGVPPLPRNRSLIPWNPLKVK